MELHTIGIALGKTIFQLIGLNLRGEVVVRKKFSRNHLLRFTANLRVELIGIEACGGAHFLGRRRPRCLEPLLLAGFPSQHGLSGRRRLVQAGHSRRVRRL
jgi:hypothetical protein